MMRKMSSLRDEGERRKPWHDCYCYGRWTGSALVQLPERSNLVSYNGIEMASSAPGP